MESLDDGSRHRIQFLKEAPAKGSQPLNSLTKGWVVAEELQIGQSPTPPHRNISYNSAAGIYVAPIILNRFKKC